MKMKDKGHSRKNRFTWLLSGLAILLLLGSAIGSGRAALAYYSDNYVAQIKTSAMGVTLVENGEDISWQNYAHKDNSWQEAKGVLLKGILKEDAKEKPCVGKAYEERLEVRNSGSIDEYVRVSIVRYWEDQAGNKRTDLSPGLLILRLAGNGWLEDKAASTDERMVLYYTQMLGAGEQTAPLSDAFMVDEAAADSVVTEVKKENGYTTVTSTSIYDGLRFVLEAKVDAVQAHHAADAIKSAWGVDVEVGKDANLRLPGQEVEE